MLFTIVISITGFLEIDFFLFCVLLKWYWLFEFDLFPVVFWFF